MKKKIKTICIIHFVVLILLLFPSLNTFGQDDNFTVALTGKYPPFSFYSSKGKLVGFDVDVSNEIAGYLGKDLQIITTNWDGILAGLLVGKYDAIIGSMAVTPGRARKVNFSLPYYVSGAQLFILKQDQNNIKGMSDLKDKKIGVVLGTTYEHYVTEHFPEVNVVTYQSAVDYFQDLLNGRISGFVTDKLVGLYQIKKSEKPFVAAGSLLYNEQMAIPVAKERIKLLTKINVAIQQMKDSDKLAKINEKWFGEDAISSTNSDVISTSVVAKKLLKGFGITLFTAFTSLLLGFIVAIPLGIVLNHHKFFLYPIVRLLSDFIRGTPLLIQLFFVFFGAPQIGITLSPLMAAIFTLAVNSSAYMAEVIRSGLMAVDQGQRLGATALGLSNVQIFRYIVWPQAFRISLPPLMNTIVALMKDTALIAIISVGEVIREAQSIISITYEPIKYYLIVAVMFFIVTFPLMKAASRLEKKIKQRGFDNA